MRVTNYIEILRMYKLNFACADFTIKMNSQDGMLSLMDLLDLDEEMVDTRLKSIMVRSNYTNDHLTNALQLLRYKNLINMQEKTECNNAEEFNFLAKLITHMNIDTVDNVCRITNIVLKLNTHTLISYSEHLLLQILSNIDLTDAIPKSPESESKTLLLLKVCDSVLDVTIEYGEKPAMFFLETSLEQILSSCDEKLKIHFITYTVPKLVEGIHGYDILSRIWSYLEELKGENRSIALKVLSSLSDFYLPVSTEEKKKKYESLIIFSNNFWDILLHGLLSDDLLLRKISVYLAKRAVDYVASLKTKVEVKLQGESLFSWHNTKQDVYKTQWDNFFMLIDSLEEKQSNIVLPSLQLFDTLTVIDHGWLNCAYNLGLRHDNGQVRLKCIEYRIKTNINNDLEATVLLGALNDINFYENTHDRRALKDKLSLVLRNENNLVHILKAIPQAHLSPVPLYHLSDIIANLDLSIDFNEHFNISKIMIDILKTPCNIVAIREAIYFNIAQFVGKLCKHLHWRDISSIYAILQTETWKADNAIFNLIKNYELKDKEHFYKYITESHCNIDFGLLYLSNHLEDIDIFMEIIYKKGKTIQDAINRQYSNKMECFEDILFMQKLQSKCDNAIKELLPNVHKTILQYVYNLLSSDVTLDVDKTKPLFNTIHFMQENGLKDIVIQLYKTATLFLTHDNKKYPPIDLEKIVQSMMVINSLSHNCHFVQTFHHEMLDVNDVLQLEATFKMRVDEAQSSGRLRNAFYEIHSKLVSKYLSRIISTMGRKSLEGPAISTKNENGNRTDCEEIAKVKEFLGKNDSVEDQELPRVTLIKPHIFNGKPNWKEVVDYTKKVIDCGGYGCLEWVLRIINDTFDYTNSHINIVQFINKTWTEIEELKSSNHYLPCMKEFVNLISQKALVNKPEYNNIVIMYCSKIIEYGIINNSALYYLVHNIHFSQFFEGQNEKINECGHLVHILSEILLFCPVPRKDQRIADNLTLDIIKTLGEDCTKSKYHFNFAIQYQAISILSKIDDPDILQTLSTFIKSKIDQTFKAKFRYHGNSQIHRTLQTALQHLMYIKFLKLNMEGGTDEWYLDLLGRMPHQPSVRICLEWHVALHLYMKKTKLDQNLLNLLQCKNVPLTSQMTIIYWLVKRRQQTSSTEEEFHFAMRTLLSHTMGQMFNIRLLAQYLAIKLHSDPSASLFNINSIYDLVIDVINKTLEDNANDKNLIKMKEDYFINEFNIVTNLTPFFIYHTQQRLCEVGSNEEINTELILKLMANIKEHTEQSINPAFKEEWIINQKHDEEFIKLEVNRNIHKKSLEIMKGLGTIQKKYIPWENISDINVYNIEKKRESPSELILVASLIDKLPNLGGMARTSEVFGVKTYVIDSLRHLQDRQFQGLSVSAERWVDMEEVRPGPPLKEYLKRKKAEGYSVVAAEQTSTSSKLQDFKFPRKTLLLLGHEKEGIPCDLLPMMDHCVEIPQQGFVRSLNVHVTAAIFVWEYTRQNIL